MGRFISLPVFVLCVSFASSMPAFSQNNDGTWKGQITCAKLSFTKGTQRVPMTMTVTGEKVSYERQVYNRDNTAVVGTEEGTGTFDKSGTIKLSATWKSRREIPRFTYTATYSGSIKGNAASLSGTQVWSVEGKPENRKCTITLKH